MSLLTLVLACGPTTGGDPDGVEVPDLGSELEWTSADPCASAKQITPKQDTELDGSGYYSVCPSPASVDAFSLHGKTATSTAVCVYPVQIANGQAYLKQDKKGAALYSCLPIPAAANSASGSGIAYSFPGVQFNALFVIEQDLLLDFQKKCLAKKDFSLCQYSYGKFRD